ncbi:uncharacterized protein [Amphiura filiformis]|uniref:uncharacterized protein n=1 Tax=Amphiura filiformis TaxID=82378 RepID=UPI003B20ECFF
MKNNSVCTFFGFIILAIEFAPVLCTHCTITETPKILSYQYVWSEIPVGATSFKFSVRASQDAHIALSDGVGDGDNQVKYEIVIGTGENTYSTISHSISGADEVMDTGEVAGENTDESTGLIVVDTPDELNSTEFRNYNISFENNLAGDLVTVSRVGESSPFMISQNTISIDVRKIGISTSDNSEGIWTFCDVHPDAENPNGNWGFEPTDDVCCPYLWSSFNGSCYRYHPYKKTWADASSYCRARGAELVSIHSAAEHSFVNRTVNGNSIWIGLTVKGRSWSDGTAVDYLPMDVTEGSGHCVKTYSFNLEIWSGSACDETRPFVCKLVNHP